MVPKKLAGWDHRPRFIEENRSIFGGWVKRLAGPPSPRGWGPDLKKKLVCERLGCASWTLDADPVNDINDEVLGTWHILTTIGAIN